ncbi:MAG: PorT family protein [Cyclobacteriaceae bacterium]|nr:PorT family protein [Cyclobacteriaceae bacterium]
MTSGRVSLFLVLFFAATHSVFAQAQAQAIRLSEIDCEQRLGKAEAEFEAGHFYGIPSILSGCLTGGQFSNDQLVRAYLILCQTYLILDDPITAGDNYLKLLKADPEFVPNETDHPIDIVYLSKQYTATPIFTPHFRLGLNTSFYRLIHAISTEPYGQTSSNPLRFGFQVGAGVDWNITDNLSLGLEGNFSLTGFERALTNGIDNDKTLILGSQSWLDFPLYAKYSFTLNKSWRPFVYSGLAASYLLSATNQFNYTDNKPNGSSLVAEGPSETVTNQRNRMAFSWVMGIGTRYKIGKNYIYADLRYMAGLTNLADQSTIYYQDEFAVNPAQVGNRSAYLSTNVTRYHYVSDLFRMDNLSLSFGFVKPLYDPRKVKKARTKGVARSIRKKGGESK